MSVWYDPRAAISPDGLISVTDVSVQFFDPADTSYTTPLSVESASHVATTVMQVSNYILPGFFGPDTGIVIAKAAELITPIEALAGLRDAAEAAQDAAEAASAIASGAVATAVMSITAGDNVSITGDPKNPTISASGGGGGGGGAVDSVNGHTGTVVLDAEDVGAAEVEHTHVIADVTNLQMTLNSKANLTHTHTASQISDSTSTGRALLTASDAAAARDVIGAGAGGSDRVLYDTGWPADRPADGGKPLQWDDTAYALDQESETDGPDESLLSVGDYWWTIVFEED